MGQTLQGIAVVRGIAIGRAVLLASGHGDVAHYFIRADEVAAETARVLAARDAVVGDLQRLQAQMPREMPPEVAAVLEVHALLLQDEHLADGVARWIAEHHYNAEWAVTAHLQTVVRQFEEMENDYLRERKADMQQVADRLLRQLAAARQAGAAAHGDGEAAHGEGDGEGGGEGDFGDDVPRVLVAHDLSPADMLQFRHGMFAGFVTDVGGKTSHTAIVARSLGVPAVVGARAASHAVRQGDWVIVDGDAGVAVVGPTPGMLAEYRQRQRQALAERERLACLKNTPALTRDGCRIELLANIEQPADAAAALEVGATGVGLFRTEFLFMGRHGRLPDEQEQYRAYCDAVHGMHGMPVTIRTIDIGADKPLDERHAAAHANPALGLRAIRWSLSQPEVFLVQLRAILRAAAHGAVHVLIPMLAHMDEVRQVHALIARARQQLDARAQVHGPIRLGAMIEVPAAAIMVRQFLRHFDFLSVGTNDLVQYTLAIDRADEAVAHLYDCLHPAVLRLLAGVIAEGARQGKPVTVCGEMAGDAAMTRLLLGLGLRSFSMHPAQLLAVKQEVLAADTRALAAWAQAVIESDDPAALLAAGV